MGQTLAQAMRNTGQRSVGHLRWLDKNETLNVRFVTGFNDSGKGWRVLWKKYDHKKQTWLVNETAEPGFHSRGYVPAVDTDTGKKFILEFPLTLVDVLTGCEDKFGSLTTHTYSLSRSGEGLKTEYTAIPVGEHGEKAFTVKAVNADCKLLSETVDRILSGEDEDQPW